MMIAYYARNHNIRFVHLSLVSLLKEVCLTDAIQEMMSVMHNNDNTMTGI